LVNGIPIHHAWLVYKEFHVLDPAITLIEEIMREKTYESIDEFRQESVRLHREYESKRNTEYRTFGQVAPFVLYIGTICKPDKGRRIYNEMIAKFPNHPSYQRDGMNPHGMSKLQKMYYEK
jgi:hypothetical protein